MTRESLLRRDNLPPGFGFPLLYCTHPNHIVSFPDSSMNCGLWSNLRSVEINVGTVLRSKTRRRSVQPRPRQVALNWIIAYTLSPLIVTEVNLLFHFHPQGGRCVSFFFKPELGVRGQSASCRVCINYSPCPGVGICSYCCTHVLHQLFFIRSVAKGVNILSGCLQWAFQRYEDEVYQFHQLVIV